MFFSKWLSRGRRTLCKIHLVDKCLLVFMAVLLLQSAYSLTSRVKPDSERSHIDIIIRTSAASIFGYFLSANFIRHSDSGRNEDGKPPRRVDSESAAAPLGRIGFADPDATPSPETGGSGMVDGDPPKPADAACLQIIAAAGIGLFCLVVLILFRDFLGTDDTANASVTATVAQLRDFVSGSVGFLLGSPTSAGGRNG